MLWAQNHWLVREVDDWFILGGMLNLGFLSFFRNSFYFIRPKHSYTRHYVFNKLSGLFLPVFLGAILQHRCIFTAWPQKRKYACVPNFWASHDVYPFVVDSPERRKAFERCVLIRDKLYIQRGLLLYICPEGRMLSSWNKRKWDGRHIERPQNIIQAVKCMSLSNPFVASTPPHNTLKKTLQIWNHLFANWFLNVTRLHILSAHALSVAKCTGLSQYVPEAPDFSWMQKMCF